MTRKILAVIAVLVWMWLTGSVPVWGQTHHHSGIATYPHVTGKDIPDEIVWGQAALMRLDDATYEAGLIDTVKRFGKLSPYAGDLVDGSTKSFRAAMRTYDVRNGHLFEQGLVYEERTAYADLISKLPLDERIKFQNIMRHMTAHQIAPTDPRLPSGAALKAQLIKEASMVASAGGMVPDNMTPEYSAGNTITYNQVNQTDNFSNPNNWKKNAESGVITFSTGKAQVTTNSASGLTDYLLLPPGTNNYCAIADIGGIPTDSSDIGIGFGASGNHGLRDNFYFITAANGKAIVGYQNSGGSEAVYSQPTFTGQKAGDQLEICYDTSGTGTLTFSYDNIAVATQTNVSGIGRVGVVGHAGNGWLSGFAAVPMYTFMTTIGVSGTTGCTGTCPSATHTPWVLFNQTQYNGTGVSPSTYINYAQTVITDTQGQFEAGDGFISNEGDTGSSGVDCSQVGDIYQDAAVNLGDQESATTVVENDYVANGLGWETTNMCNPPPQMYPPIPPFPLGSGPYSMPCSDFDFVTVTVRSWNTQGEEIPTIAWYGWELRTACFRAPTTWTGVNWSTFAAQWVGCIEPTQTEAAIVTGALDYAESAPWGTGAPYYKFYATVRDVWYGHTWNPNNPEYPTGQYTGWPYTYPIWGPPGVFGWDSWPLNLP